MLKQKLLERENWLAKIIKQKEEKIEKAPQGTLRVSRRDEKIEYYHHMPLDTSNGIYLKKKEKKLIQALAQKEYDKKVLEKAREEHKIISKINNAYKSGSVEDVLQSIALGKRELVNPVYLPDEAYIEQWSKKPYVGLHFKEGTPEYYTDKGERVRSKSEIIIANLLNQKKIPYKYECPLKLESYKVVYPDFTVLDVKNRKEIYWEHLGLMDDEEYVNKNLEKLVKYEANGYYPGDKLILTFETSKQPLNSKVIEMIIHKYLLG